MWADIGILVGILLCQAATGYWAFHMSVGDNRARVGFAALTVIGVGLAVWGGFRSGQASDALNNNIAGIKASMSRIASAANLDPNQSANDLANKIIEKFNDLQSQINQTNANVQTLQNPPPDPNTLYQNNNPVGNVIEGYKPPISTTMYFNEIDNAEIDFSENVDLRNFILKCPPTPVTIEGISPITGRPAREILTNLVCTIQTEITNPPAAPPQVPAQQ